MSDQERVQRILENIAKQGVLKTKQSSETKNKSRTVTLTSESINPTSGNSENAARLHAYRKLEKPFPLAQIPTRKKFKDLEQSVPEAQRMLEHCVLEVDFAKKVGSKSVPLKDVLIYGPPGSGKTYLAKRLAKTISNNIFFYSAAGVNSAVDIVGQPETYKAADASLPVRAMVNCGIADPAIVIDEIDKAGSSDHNGNFHLGLMSIIAKESAANYLDPFLQAHIDCSYVRYIATANDISSLPDALLDRFEIHELPRPSVEYLDIYIDGFRKELASKYQIKERKLSKVDDLMRLRLEKIMKSGGSLRELQAEYETSIKRKTLRCVPRKKKSHAKSISDQILSVRA